MSAIPLAEPAAPPPPQRPPLWPVFLAYGVVFVLLIAGAAVILGGGFLAKLAKQPDRIQDAEDVIPLLEELMASPTVLLASGVNSTLTILLSVLVAVKLEGARFAPRLRLERARATPLAAAIFVVGFFCLSQSMDSLTSVLGIKVTGTIAMMTSAFSQASGPLFPVLLFFVGPMAGFSEELFFRGYMQTRLRQHWRPWPAIAVTAALFGLLHLDPLHSPFAFVVGLFLGWVTELTGSLWPAIAAHVVNNTVWALSTAYLPEPLARATHAAMLGVLALVVTASIVALRRLYGGGVARA